MQRRNASKNVKIFSLQHFKELTENKEVQEKSLEGLPTTACKSPVSLYELDSKQVAGPNRWMSSYTNKH